MKKIKISLIGILIFVILSGCTKGNTENILKTKVSKDTIIETSIINETTVEKFVEESIEEPKTEIVTKAPTVEKTNNEDKYSYNGKDYLIIEVEGGNLSGYRQSNVAVDVGFGDRTYWALTNEYGQLVYVIADKIILQDDEAEAVNSKGRYYNDEAKVPGTERADLDEGHVIADSLGGVSNAYNITPQDSVLNRHGDQAYMEKVIRDAGGCTNFVATISYADTETQIPSTYKYDYILKGNRIIDEFLNINPDNSAITETVTKKNDVSIDIIDISSIDTNGNGIVTIAEAKAAGYKMPITSEHPLYKYMIDRDGDGMVGE